MRSLIAYERGYKPLFKYQRHAKPKMNWRSTYDSIGVAAAGVPLGVMPLLYGGLAIAGLAIFSAFWDW